jgi:uncharacterized membrane protein YbaN (DUF454 family)
MGDYNDPNVNNNEQQSNDQLPDQHQRQQETDYVPEYQQSEYQNLNQQTNDQQNQYHQPPYQQPNQNQYQYYNPYQQYQKKNNGMAIAALVCGIVSFVFNCCFWFLSIPVGIAGIVLGIISIKNKRDGKSMAIVGIVLSGIAIVLALLLFVACSVITSNESFFNQFYNQIYNDLDIESYY